MKAKEKKKPEIKKGYQKMFSSVLSSHNAGEYEAIVVCYNCGYADTYKIFSRAGHLEAWTGCPKCKSNAWFYGSKEHFNKRF